MAVEERSSAEENYRWHLIGSQILTHGRTDQAWTFVAGPKLDLERHVFFDKLMGEAHLASPGFTFTEV